MLPDAIHEHIDVISAVASIIGAFVCAYLSQVILRERTPLVQIQRATLGLLGLALFANGVLSIPDWEIVNGHRPTGALVNVCLMVNLIVMAVRGHVMYQSGLHFYDHHPEAGSSDRRRSN